jgi:hypothetical protein
MKLSSKSIEAVKDNELSGKAMEQRACQRISEEIAEIERHKYFLSEKAGHDVGWEFAERDWDENYGHRGIPDPSTQTESKTTGGWSNWFKRWLLRIDIP